MKKYTSHIAKNGIDLSRINNGITVIDTITCNVTQSPCGLFDQIGIRTVKQAKQIRNGIGIDSYSSL